MYLTVRFTVLSEILIETATTEYVWNYVPSSIRQNGNPVKTNFVTIFSAMFATKRHVRLNDLKVLCPDNCWMNSFYIVCRTN